MENRIKELIKTYREIIKNYKILNKKKDYSAKIYCLENIIEDLENIIK